MAISWTDWQNRADALDEHIDLVKTRIATLDALLFGLAGKHLPRMGTLTALADALKIFSKGHFDFFRDGFDRHAIRTFKVSKDFPPDYVMSQVIDRISSDVRALQQIVEQRSLYALDQTLDIADKLAYIALLPAMKHNLLDNRTTVITYFQRDASIRVIPYASVALIGIPLTARKVNADFLAIPHEVGHYVYWNANQNNNMATPLKEIIKASNPFNTHKEWALKWREEIFADVYGALVGGRAITLNFQDLLNEESKEGFEMDDKHHPIPRLRPDIYLEVLKQKYINAVLQPTADLATNWTNILAARGHTPPSDPLPTIKIGSPDCGDFYSPDEIRQELLGITNAILAFLPDPQNGALFQPLSLDIALNPITAGKTIYEVFEDRIPIGTGKIVPGTLDAAPKAYTLWDTWANDRQYKAVTAPTNPVPEADWIEVLQANGWTTSGPHLPPGDE